MGTPPVPSGNGSTNQQPGAAQNPSAGAPGNGSSESSAPSSTAPQGQTSGPISVTVNSTPLTLSSGPYYGKGKSWFPDIIAPYTPLHIDHPQFVNSPKINQLIRDGKMYLSLRDAIALALENNVDISVAQYAPWVAQTDILRTLSGGAARGAAGTGTAQVLGSIPTATFDPVLTSQLSWQRSAIPINNPLLSGTGVTSSQLQALVNYTAQANFTYSQAFHTGTSISVSWFNTRGSSNSGQALFNPFVQSTATFFIQQPLLNGFGLLANTRFIIEAQNSEKIAESQVEQQVMTTITQVQTDYWELVYARENVNVQQAAVRTSQKLYGDNQKQVNIGTLAPIEVTRADSQLATNQQNLIVAQTTALQQQTVLINAISKNPMDPVLQGVKIIPTDDIPAPPPTENLSLQQAVNEAWTKRPEIKQAQLNLKNLGIEVKVTRNSLLPTANLFGEYQATGLGGNFVATSQTATSFIADTNAPLVNSGGQPILVNGVPVYLGTPLAFTQTSSITPGGLGDALQQIADRRFPTYAVGMNITLPIRNRAAQADAARALLNERQTQTTYQQTQNTIMLDVRNTMIALEQDRARVDAASRASVLARETLDAEQKKYQLGASTTFLVIQDERDMTSAEGTEIRAKADLIEAQINYDKALGRTLEVNNISVGDAKSRSISRTPNIPGTPSNQLPGGASQ
jgi:outer membrane protein TolC